MPRTHSFGIVVLSAILAAFSPAFAQQPSYDDVTKGPLPRVREGGAPKEDYVRPFFPYAIQRNPIGTNDNAPTTGIIDSPPEYSPSAGIMLRYSTGSFPDVVRNIVGALTGSASYNEIAYVVVSNTSQQSSAVTDFLNAGANTNKVQFILQANDSIWLRDYGPHFIFHDGVRAIADSHYYPTRPNDNFIPTAVSQGAFGMKSFNMPLYYSGGNFQPGPNRSGFITSLINQDNSGFSTAYISELYQRYQGIDTLHIFTRLPSTVDGTGHIDMWLYLVDEDTVIISEFLPGSNATAIQITNDAVTYMQGLGFNVVRTPAWNSGGTHYTYANAFRVNNRIFIPTYGQGNSNYIQYDNQATTAWQTAAGPGVTIVPINCFGIIPLSGAIHCIMMQVPRQDSTTPIAKLLSPDGGEVLNVGGTHDIRWHSDDNASVTGVNIRYSVDDGLTYPYVIATNQPRTGSFTWTVPNTLSKTARVKVIARDANSNTGESVSAAPFTIACTAERAYGFLGAVGVSKWVWGYATSGWSQLSGIRRPAGVATQLSAADCLKMQTSDATGGSSDANRYVTPSPGTNNRTTLIYEFTISQSIPTIRQIRADWEGYSNNCSQMEMYVWDYVANNWSDGSGVLSGENRFMNNYAGNADQMIQGRITGNFNRYIDGSTGRMTYLLFGDRSGNSSYHDFVQIVVTYSTRGDLNGDGAVTAADIPLFAAVLLGQDTDVNRVTASDANCDLLADGPDVQSFLNELLN